MSRAVMQQAFDALRTCSWSRETEDAITALREELAKTEQEPVVFCMHWEDRWGPNHYVDPKEPHPVNAKPLYAAPPQRTWQGLTDDEAGEIYYRFDGMELMRAIEAKLKEKNT